MRGQEEGGDASAGTGGQTKRESGRWRPKLLLASELGLPADGGTRVHSWGGHLHKPLPPPPPSSSTRAQPPRTKSGKTEKVEGHSPRAQLHRPAHR